MSITSAKAKVTLALLAALPAVATRLSGIHLGPLAKVVVFGSAVVATAFVLTWAAEAAQLDISGSLATAVVAVIAVLPEYAVDMYFGYSAGHVPGQAQFAAANMTGSNRLLIGIGWPLAVFVTLAAYRRRSKRSGGAAADPGAAGVVRIEPARRVEIGFLALASAFAFVIVASGVLAWWSSIVLFVLFGLYLWRLSGEPKSEPQLIGVSAALATLSRPRRRALVSLLLLLSAVIVVGAAKPFADGLVASGDQLGVDKFLLVQWVAPLASEAPELIVAGLFAWRLRGGDALGILLSSKVNQWTLLVGGLPLAYLAGGGHQAFPLDVRQSEEFLLTATQALLALAIVMDLSFSRREAMALLLLFLVQLPFPETGVRLALSAIYAVAALTYLSVRHGYILPVAKTAFVTGLARGRGPRALPRLGASRDAVAERKP